MTATLLDLKRLRNAERVSMLPEPRDGDEVAAQIEALDDAILALQSLDDLGSREANQKADKEMLRLQARRDELKRRARP